MERLATGAGNKKACPLLSRPVMGKKEKVFPGNYNPKSAAMRSYSVNIPYQQCKGTPGFLEVTSST